MNVSGNMRRRPASDNKVLIALTCLLLFVPQLSYKFYLAANIPTVFANQQLSFAHVGHSTNVHSSFGHDRRHRLRIDKRYALNQAAALPETELVLGHRYSNGLLILGHPGCVLFDSFLLHHLVRGPPAFTSDKIRLV